VAAYDALLADYEHELIDEMGDHEPCFFPFSRILFTATRPCADDRLGTAASS
jgi:hypothetical protein